MSSRRFFGIFLLFSVIVYVVGQCTWTDQPNAGGNENMRNKLGEFTNDLAACKDKCDSACVAIDFSFPNCYGYTTTPTTSASAGSTHSTKTCAVVTTTETPTTAGNAACSMAQQSDTGVTSTAQVTVDLTAVGDCENLCKAIPQCRAYSHTPGTCDIHTSDDASTSNAAGYVFARKQSCSGNGQGFCCFEGAQADTKGSAGTTTSFSQNSCQSMCLAVSACQGTAVSGNACYFYTTTPSTTGQAGSTYYEKTCPSGADRGSLTLSACDSATNTRLSQVLLIWTLMTTLFST